MKNLNPVSPQPSRCFQRSYLRPLILLVIPILMWVSTALGGSDSSSDNNNAPPSADKPIMGNKVFVIPAAEIPGLQYEALNGSGEAAYKLAQFHYMITLDFKDGLYWMTIAAENGDMRGIYGLGYQLNAESGNDAKMKLRARYWLERAKKEGDDQIASFAAMALVGMDKEQQEREQKVRDREDMERVQRE